MTGQTFECPFAAHGLDAFGRHQFEQMADRRRKDVLVAFVVVVHFLEPAERLGDVAGDGRFLRNDECFAHLCARAFTPGAANMRRKSFLSNRELEERRQSNSPSLRRRDGQGEVLFEPPMKTNQHQFYDHKRTPRAHRISLSRRSGDGATINHSTLHADAIEIAAAVLGDLSQWLPLLNTIKPL